VAVERGALSLVSITEELLEWKGSGSGSRDMTNKSVIYFGDYV
jgi:hypothetical protein